MDKALKYVALAALLFVAWLPLRAQILQQVMQPSGGTTYYISNSGSDSNNGTSTGSPWQTVAKVNAATFQPGDQVEFNCANEWHEELLVPSSGIAGNPVTYTSYPACGTNPIITGADVVGAGGWTQNSVTPLDTQTFSTGALSGAYWTNHSCTFPTSPAQGASTHSLQCGGATEYLQTTGAPNSNSYEMDAYFQLQSSTATSGQKTEIFTEEGSGMERR